MCGKMACVVVECGGRKEGVKGRSYACRGGGGEAGVAELLTVKVAEMRIQCTGLPTSAKRHRVASQARVGRHERSGFREEPTAWCRSSDD